MKILLVDDNEDDRFLIKITLKGQEITEATNLDEGLQKFGEKNFDLVLTDWNLGSGTTAEKLVEQALDKHVRTVIRTALTDRLGELSQLRDTYNGRAEILSKLSFHYREELRRTIER